MSFMESLTNSGFLNRLVMFRPLSAAYFGCVRFLASAFVPFDRFFPLTLIFLLITVASFAVPLFVLSYVFIILVICSFVLFGLALRRKAHPEKSMSGVLSFLFMGCSLSRFLNFAVFVLLVLANIVGIVVSWFV